MRNIIPYFDNDHSFSSFKIPGFETDMIIKVAFPQQESTIMVATTFGNLFYAKFDPNAPGNAKQIK
jgi:hypothetical protein